MVLAIFIFFLIIVLLVVDFRISVVVYYDLKTNIGKIKLKVFGLSVFSGEFSLVGDYINFVENNKKVIQIRLVDIDEKTLKFINDIVKSFVRRINLLKIYLYSIICGENPFGTSIFSGALSSVMGVGTTLLQAKYPYAMCSSTVATDYLTDRFVVGANSTIVINLYDLLWSLIRTIYVRSFGVYGQKKYSK